MDKLSFKFPWQKKKKENLLQRYAVIMTNEVKNEIEKNKLEAKLARGFSKLILK